MRVNLVRADMAASVGKVKGLEADSRSLQRPVSTSRITEKK